MNVKGKLYCRWKTKMIEGTYQVIKRDKHLLLLESILWSPPLLHPPLAPHTPHSVSTSPAVSQCVPVKLRGLNPLGCSLGKLFEISCFLLHDMSASDQIKQTICPPSLPITLTFWEGKGHFWLPLPWALRLSVKACEINDHAHTSSTVH